MSVSEITQVGLTAHDCNVVHPLHGHKGFVTVHSRPKLPETYICVKA